MGARETAGTPRRALHPDEDHGHRAGRSLRTHGCAVVDASTINYQATLDDPKAFTRPWTVAFPIRRIKDPKYELYEEACLEGNDPTIDGMLHVGRELEAKGVKGRHEHTLGFYDE